MGVLCSEDDLLPSWPLPVSFPALVGVAASRAFQLFPGTLEGSALLVASQFYQGTNYNHAAPARQPASSSARFRRLLSRGRVCLPAPPVSGFGGCLRSEEHTSE